SSCFTGPPPTELSTLSLHDALPIWLAFAARGAGRQFIYDNVVINAKWRWRTGRHLRWVFDASWPILLLGAVGAAVALRRPSAAGSEEHTSGLPSLTQLRLRPLA